MIGAPARNQAMRASRAPGGAAPAHTGRRSVYWPLVGALTECTERTVTLTFVEVERALGQPLALDAYERRSWWLSAPSGPSRALHSAGWRVVSVDVLGNVVTFARESG